MEERRYGLFAEYPYVIIVVTDNTIGVSAVGEFDDLEDAFALSGFGSAGFGEDASGSQCHMGHDCTRLLATHQI